MKSLIFGKGVNDATYNVVQVQEYPKQNGKRIQKQTWICPYYRKWTGILQRCYSDKHLKRRPDYIGCSTSDEWLTFSNFANWVDSQPNKNWQNDQLDKDLLVNGNKIYSANTCVFIPKQLNIFLATRFKARGDYIIGVSFCKNKNMFRATVNNPFTRSSHHLGYFKTELEAHKAWQAKKHEYACKFADLQEDVRVADALRQRYALEKDWTKA